MSTNNLLRPPQLQNQTTTTTTTFTTTPTAPGTYLAGKCTIVSDGTGILTNLPASTTTTVVPINNYFYDINTIGTGAWNYAITPLVLGSPGQKFLVLSLGNLYRAKDCFYVYDEKKANILNVFSNDTILFVEKNETEIKGLFLTDDHKGKKCIFSSSGGSTYCPMNMLSTEDGDFLFPSSLLEKVKCSEKETNEK